MADPCTLVDIDSVCVFVYIRRTKVISTAGYTWYIFVVAFNAYKLGKLIQSQINSSSQVQTVAFYLFIAIAWLQIAANN